MRHRLLLTTMLTLALPLVPAAAADDDPDGAPDPASCAASLVDPTYVPMWWENATALRIAAEDATFHILRQTHVPQNATNLTEVENATIPDDPIPAPPFLDLANKTNATVNAQQHVTGSGPAARDCIDRSLGATATLDAATKEVGRLVGETSPYHANLTAGLLAFEKEVECTLASAAFPPGPEECRPEENETRRMTL